MAATRLLMVLLLVMGAAVATAIIIFTVSFVHRRRRHPACGRCGYDVTASIGHASRCPECGSDFAQVGIRPPGRRSLAPLVAISITLVVCTGVFMLGALMAARARAEVAVARAMAAQAAAAAAAAQANAAPAPNAAGNGLPADEEAQGEGGAHPEEGGNTRGAP